MRNIYLSCFIIILTACSGRREPEQAVSESLPVQEQHVPASGAGFEVAFFRNTDSTFGYAIKREAKVMVHQPNIPAVSGNSGFISQEEAGKVAALMVEKIEKKIMPPSVSVQELDSLGITY